MRRLAVIRADASAEIGGGHVTRCLTLADALLQGNWVCEFAVRPGTQHIVPSLARSPHRYWFLEGSQANESQELACRYGHGADLVVVDHFGRGRDFERACRNWAGRVMAIDGMGRNHDCDLLLDINPDRAPSFYRGRVPEHTRLLLGPRHALIRPVFAEWRQHSLLRRLEGRIDCVLLSFGAGPVADLLQTSLQALDLAGFRGLVIAVVGADQALRQAIAQTGACLGFTLETECWVEDMAALTARADLAIGAPGMSTWERCCLGVPSIVVQIAHNQRNFLRSVCEQGAALSMGKREDLNLEEMTKACHSLMKDRDAYIRMSKAAASLSDGLGVQRVSESIDFSMSNPTEN